MQLTIISLNYKNPELTIQSMNSVYVAYKEQFEKKQFEYILVDNYSNDTSSSLLSKAVGEYSGFHFLESSINNGFGAGCNLGAQKGKGEYLLFINNDTQVKGNGIVDMVEYLKAHEEIAILGGQLQNFNGTNQSSVGTFYTLFQVLFLLLGFQRFGITDKNPKAPSRVDWVKGALYMIRKNVFDKLEGFDEKIFMYTEDMELCYRAKKKGYVTYFFPTEGIFHKEHGSSNRSFAIIHIYKGIIYFYKKHMPKWKFTLVHFLLTLKATIFVILGKITGNAYLRSTYAQALEVLR